MKTKLLIVDDSSVSRMIVRGRIAAIKPEWEVVEASNGDEALVVFAREQPDLVTMDVNMPGMSGFEAAEKLRALSADVKIVILTANIQGSSREKAVQLGVQFVQKPVTQASIQQVVDHFLVAP